MVVCMAPVVVCSLVNFLWYVITGWKYTAGASMRFGLVFFTFLMVSYLVSSVSFFWNWRQDAINDRRRILTLNDGLSPIVPVVAILLAWALWAWLQLRRVKFIAHRKMNLLANIDAAPAHTAPDSHE